MKIRYILLVITLITMVIYGIGCAQKEPTEPVSDYSSLLEHLRSAGAMVESAGDIDQPFFSTKGKAIKINGEDVQVFEYQNNTAAESEAQLISPDGSSIGTSIPFWVGPPHFYKTGRLIVLYIGENSTVMDLLSSVLGAQFAGR